VPGRAGGTALHSAFYSGNKFKGYLVLSVAPTVVLYQGTFQDLPDTRAPELPTGIEVDAVIEALSWWVCPDAVAAIALRYDRQDDGVQRMLMCNAPDEDSARSACGVDGFHCPDEIFVPDSIFMPYELECRYDAIYVARLDAFKRHELARGVERLRLLTGGLGAADFHEGLLRAEPDQLTALGLHETASASFEMLSLPAVCREINRSACGLALSATEGMMRASTQYLLCGRPVVSTASRGGREQFYDDYNAIIAEDDPAAVRQAVADLVAERRDPWRIRGAIMGLLNRHRYGFSRQISALRTRLGGSYLSPERIMSDLFVGGGDRPLRYVDGGAGLQAGDVAARFAYPEKEVMFRPAGGARLERTDDPCLMRNTQEQDIGVRLSDSAAWIVDRLDGTVTVDGVIGELRDRFPREPGIDDQVRDAVAKLIGMGALEPDVAAAARRRSR